MRLLLQIRAVACSAALLASISNAADFRALDFDESCDDVTALEVARGASVFEGKLPSGYQFAFRAREMNREALVAYACRDGQFYRGAYIFDVTDAVEATRLYAEVKQRVTRELGAPYYDFASQEHRRKMSEVGATLSQADTQVAFWKAPRSEAHASVIVPASDRGWRVSLSYTALSALGE